MSEQELEARFEYLESQVKWLEEKLTEVGQILETELGHQASPTVGSSVVQVASRRETRRLDESIHVGIDIDESAAESLSTSMYNAVAGSVSAIGRLFK